MLVAWIVLLSAALAVVIHPGSSRSSTPAKAHFVIAAEDGVSPSLKYEPGWSPAQRAAADTKVGALNDAAGGGGLRVTQVERSGTSAAWRDSRAGGDISSGADDDYKIDLQLGGLDELSNMSPLNLSVNRSLGAQMGCNSEMLNSVRASSL